MIATYRWCWLCRGWRAFVTRIFDGEKCLLCPTCNCFTVAYEEDQTLDRPLAPRFYP